MQKMLASVEAWPVPSVMSPAGEPLSVIVCTPPPAGPKAPESSCWQSGHVPFPSVHWVGDVHALWGHRGSGKPSKQPVVALGGSPVAVPPASRQKPQNTLSWPLSVAAVMVVVAVVNAKLIWRPPMLLPGGGGQSWLVGKLAFSA
jgi:hypothetical protein